MKLPAYPEYATTRDTWVGYAPIHWQFLRADFTTTSNKEQISDVAMEGIDVLHYSIPNVQEFGTAQIEDGNEIDSAKLRITTAQLLISKLNPRKATVCIAQPDDKLLTVCSGEFVPIIPQGDLTLRYCYYTWMSDKVTNLLSSRVQSVTRSHQRVSPDDITKLPWAWPPKQEQQQIAAFLDWKTGQIDALIARKHELLEKLKEKRIAVITQAVTRGLDLAAPLRDSGISWLGQVPQHWEVGGFTKYVEDRADYRGKTPEKVRDGVFLVTAKNIKGGTIDYEASQEYVREDEYFDIMSRGLPRIGDLLFTTEAPLGEVANIDREDIALAQRVIKFRGEPLKLNNYFAKFWMMSAPFQAHLKSLATGSTALGIKASKLFALRCVVPPLDEQQRIVAFLNEKRREFSTMEETVSKAIDRLAEYRTALITAATTGKIDVRNVKIPEPLA